jgi:lysophospholipase L1-like esterase
MRSVSMLVLCTSAVALAAACGPRPTSSGTGGRGGGAGTAGVGGVSGTAGVGGTSGTGGTTSGPRPPCLTKGSQVVVIGDSYMTTNTPYLVTQRLAQQAGAPTPYRSYAQGGTSMVPGQIPAQFTRAVNADRDVKVLIFNGGGNNVLIGARQCLETGASRNAQCQQVVQTAIDTSNQLGLDAAAAGVKDSVFFYYPHLPAGLFSGSAPNELLDYSLPRAKEACEASYTRTGGRMNCYFINTVPLFEGHPEYIGGDGIHPTAAGAQVIGNAIWEVMKSRCIGQPASSGCCQP